MSEKTVIVNDKDEIVSYKNRELIKSNDIYRVSALWIINSQEQILFAKRSFNKINNPGKWGPAVSGTVEENENYLNNIIKETREEIGIDLTQYSFEKIEKIYTDGKYNFFCQWYLLKEDIDINNLEIQKDEVEEIKWMNKEKFRNNLKKNPKKYTISMQKHFDILQKY